nr:MAG TPA: hypothetical protein [Caudoviricetes sp.]
MDPRGRVYHLPFRFAGLLDEWHFHRTEIRTFFRVNAVSKQPTP